MFLIFSQPIGFWQFWENMYFSFHCVRLGVYFAFAWIIAVEAISQPEKDYGLMRRAWEKCCDNNVCIQNSCFTPEWRPLNWATARQKCQNRFADWPYAVDIFRFQKQSDIEIISRKLRVGIRISGNRPFWSSGTRCPSTGPEGPVFVTRWSPTNLPFPDWLDDQINNTTSAEEPDIKEGCKFLVVYPAPYSAEVKYDFQDQKTHHAAICEFVFPEDVESTTQYVNTDSTRSSTFIDDKNGNRSKTLKPADRMDLTSKTLHSTAKTTSKLTTMSTVTPSPTPNLNETITVKPPKFCKGKQVYDIAWPDTPSGETANMSCPQGMTGYAQWKCSQSTLQFTPEKPHIQDCKHAWIKSLEDEINQGVEDAVDISHKLANETGQKNMSHGDITALVDLSSKLFQLYVQQSDQTYDETKLENQPLSYNFTGHMVSSMSNILRAEIKAAWEVLPQIHQTRAASKILQIVTKMGSRLSCFKQSFEKLQFTVTAENIGLQTFVLNSTLSSEEDFIVFPQRVPEVEYQSSLSLPANFEFNDWYSPCKSMKTAVGILYNHVGDFLKDENVSRSKTHVATKVISFSLGNNTESVSLPKGNNVTVVLRHLLQQDIEKGLLKNARCMFWNFSKQTYGQWDNSGCYRVYSNLTHTVCTCDHLTNFAVLMDVNNNIEEDEILSLMTYICCGVSSVALLITLIFLISIRSLHGRRSIITGNLCLSLLITNLLVIFGLDRTESKVICATIAGLLHFWILSAFFWMLVEGYHLYKMVILVFQRGSDLSVKLYYLFAYGCPMITVAISASIRTDNYGGDKYCWLSSSQGLIWSFVGPACAVILVNSIIFFLTLRSASSVRIKREQTTVKKIKNWARGSMSVMCLLGLTWCLGLLYIDKKLHIVSYVFTLTNGLQGVFIFIFHILLNEKVKACCFMKWKGIKQEHSKNFPTQTSSNRLHSKMSTCTSINSNGGHATSFHSRTTSTAITNLSKQSREGKMNSTNTRNFNPQINICSRKNPAARILSENGKQHLPVSVQEKERSHSLTNEVENKFPTNPHVRISNGFVKYC